MTTNQLIVLLDIDRGFHESGHTRTLQHDLSELQFLGLIYHDNIDYETTKGDGSHYIISDRGNALLKVIHAIIVWPDYSDKS